MQQFLLTLLAADPSRFGLINFLRQLSAGETFNHIADLYPSIAVPIRR
jgi:hypothetical protein